MEPKMLREINNDAITPKKRDKKVQNDLLDVKFFRDNLIKFLVLIYLH